MNDDESKLSQNVTDAIATLEQYLEDSGWQFLKPSLDVPIYSMKYRGDNGRIHCTAKIFVEFEQFLFSAYPDFDIPDDRISDVMEFITRANNSLIIGTFALNIEEGELRFKSSISFEGTQLSVQELGSIISVTVQTLDMHIPGIIKVIEGQQSPADAFSAVSE